MSRKRNYRKYPNTWRLKHVLMNDFQENGWNWRDSKMAARGRKQKASFL
jgi:hypothetical protein